MRRLLFSPALFSLAVLFASSAAAPALAGPDDPPPPPPPPRLGTTLSLTGADGLLLGLNFNDSLPAISSDAVSFGWSAKLGVPIRLRNVEAGDLLPGFIGDPTLKLGLIGTATPYDNPFFTLTGGALLEARLSDLTPRPYIFLAVQETVSNLRLSVEARYDVGDNEYALRHDFTIAGICRYIIPNRAPTAPAGARYDCDFDQVSGVTSAAAVPEPATWGLMILGLAAAGSVLRRRPAARPALEPDQAAASPAAPHSA